MGDTLPGARYDKRKERRGYSTVQAIDPHDGGTWDVLLSGRRIEWTQKQGLGATRELAFTVPWALRNIRHLFRGVRDDDRDVNDDGWLCYVSTPSSAYDWKTGKNVPAWPREVFVVYVTDERVVYHWFWVKCDPDEPYFPIGYEERFSERVF